MILNSQLESGIETDSQLEASEIFKKMYAKVL